MRRYLQGESVIYCFPLSISNFCIAWQRKFMVLGYNSNRFLPSRSTFRIVIQIKFIGIWLLFWSFLLSRPTFCIVIQTNLSLLVLEYNSRSCCFLPSRSTFRIIWQRNLKKNWTFTQKYLQKSSKCSHFLKENPN